MAAASSARGRRRAPKRRRRARSLIIVLASAVGVVGTGVAIGWGSHVFANHRTAQNTDAPEDQLSGSASPGSPTPTSSTTAKGATAPPSSSGAKPSSAAPSQDRSSGSAVPKNPLPHATGPGTLTTLDVASADTDMKSRPVVVYRPAVPANVVLPVVYLLHGVPGEPQPLMDAIKPALDQAFTTGGLAPFEVAAPTGGGSAHNDTEWADAADGADLVETYLFKNVIPAVEGDEASRARLREIHRSSIAELEKGLAPELVAELERLSLPFAEDEVPSESELRIAQAQLVGWLEGLFHGIQTALFAQQMAARAQLEQIRRALPPGSVPPGMAGGDEPRGPIGGAGPYL